MAVDTGFPHLNVTTAFSAHYGVSWPEDLVAQAHADGAQILACTDRDGLYGMAKHIRACLKHGIAPVVGVNLAVAWDDQAPAPGQPPQHPAGRVTILAAAKTQVGQGSSAFLGAGYQALVRLISAAHAHTLGGTTGGDPYVTIHELAHHIGLSRHKYDDPPALYVLVGPDSDAGQLLAKRRYSAGRQRMKRWRKSLPLGSVRVEVVSHLAHPGAKLSTTHAIKLFRVAKDLGLPGVLTNAVRYAQPDGAATADVLDAARALQSLDTVADLQPTGQGWLKSSSQMHELAYEISYEAGFGARGAKDLLQDTHRLAETCALDPTSDMGWGKPRVPEASVIGHAQDAKTELTHRSRAGITERFPDVAAGSVLENRLHERLEHELNIIHDLGFASYFLTVAEVVSMIEERGVRVSARGSGASSLVNYALRISHVDPLEHDLIFERFLSQDRSTLPDIDIDVESAQRKDIYHAIFDRFGAERTTLMSMQNGYRVRGAVRDAGRALGMDHPQIDHIAKQMWRFSGSQFREAMQHMPELKGFSEQLEQQRRGGGKQLDLLVDLTERLDRLPRHISMHPCGVILGDASLLDRTPVQPSGMGLPMSQFDKHDMDPLGMLKLDVLGVRMQSTIAYALEEVHRTTGETIDLERVPLDDEATYDMIQTTHTLGCFQIESPGQRELIGRLEPRNINDVIIDISLFRPGPMQSDMVRPFLDFRNGDAEARYPHPKLKPILEETHGVTVFHEQILRTFDAITGCGLARADEFRRRLGTSEEHEVEEYFRARAIERGWEVSVVDEVWETISAFGSFGFCKAHGAAFAIPTFHSAWLKTHHPAAFMAAVFEHDPGMYPRRLMVAEARRMGIPILPVDINASTDRMQLEWVPSHPELDTPNPETVSETVPEGHGPGQWGIRLSWQTVRGMSHREIKRLVNHQPYDSLADVRDRARPKKSSLENMAQLGALDSLLPVGQASRTDLVHYLELNHSATRVDRTGRKPRATKPQIEGQQAFNLTDTELNHLPAVFPTPSAQDQVRTELDLTALDTTQHLMESHYPYLDALGVTPAKDLLKLRSRSRVLVAGVRVATQTPPMRTGQRVVFISVDDGTGVIDTSFFTQAQHASGPLLFSTRLLLIEGTTRRTGRNAISVQAIRAWDLHDPASLPDPDYLSSTRDQWTQWLSRASQNMPADVPHHTTGHLGLTGQTGAKPLQPVPVPDPETWAMMPIRHEATVRSGHQRHGT